MSDEDEERSRSVPAVNSTKEAGRRLARGGFEVTPFDTFTLVVDECEERATVVNPTGGDEEGMGEDVTNALDRFGDRAGTFVDGPADVDDVLYNDQPSQKELAEAVEELEPDNLLFATDASPDYDVEEVEGVGQFSESDGPPRTDLREADDGGLATPITLGEGTVEKPARNPGRSRADALLEQSDEGRPAGHSGAVAYVGTGDSGVAMRHSGLTLTPGTGTVLTASDDLDGTEAERIGERFSQREGGAEGVTWKMTSAVVAGGDAEPLVEKAKEIDHSAFGALVANGQAMDLLTQETFGALNDANADLCTDGDAARVLCGNVNSNGSPPRLHDMAQSALSRRERDKSTNEQELVE